MAITLYSGPPGAGKSYALVEQVIVPAVLAGRRVLTNVAGVKPDLVHDYCAGRVPDADQLGHVVLFDGHRAVEPGFFPTEDKPDDGTVVKGGDLIVFDEWRLYWPRREKLPSPDLEPFLRWHRHLVDAKGTTCDVVIGSQLSTDLHQDFRGLVERSYKFRKLKAVGLNKAYAWDAYEGHLQPKGGSYAKGNGTYKKEIYALYSSYSGGANGSELKTDKREGIFQRWLLVAIPAGVAMFAACLWFLWGYFNPPQPKPAGAVAQALASQAAPGAPPAPALPPVSDFRIAGQVEDLGGVRVILVNARGDVRTATPAGFVFDGARPVSGTFEGKRVFADQGLSLPPTGLLAPSLTAAGVQ
jgi:zona occludens toxin